MQVGRHRRLMRIPRTFFSPDRSSVLLYLLASLFFSGVWARASSPVTLTTSPNPSSWGAPVVLTANLGTGATGWVTFYDGTNILGAGIVSNGTASLTTVFLQTGSRSLHAYYSGDESGGAGASNTVSQVVQTAPAGALQSAVNYTAGTAPSAIVAGDFNGDGKIDLAVANQGSNNASVLLENGDGTFAPAVNYGTGLAPSSIAVGDFNQDGKPDLAVANSQGGSVSILLGNGDGTFQTALSFMAGPNPASIAVADFNGDGIADLVVANAGSNTVSVLLGKGDGTFGAAVKLPGRHPTGSAGRGGF